MEIQVGAYSGFHRLDSIQSTDWIAILFFNFWFPRAHIQNLEGPIGEERIFTP